MENLPATRPERRPLPKIDELYQDIELAGKHNELNRLLNCSPKPEWIRVNKFANNSQYLPIGIVEYLLTSIFLKFRVEIKSTQLIANSVVVAIRLYVLDPITGEWDWQDGIGASPIQTEKGAAATDFAKVNTAAVQMAAPAAESYAFKDAAEKFGRLFGKDLNRKDENQMNYGNLESKLQVEKKMEVPEELKVVIAEADADNLAAIYRANPEYHNIPLFMQLLGARQVALKAQKNAANAQPA
jgi:hypothetical protein